MSAPAHARPRPGARIDPRLRQRRNDVLRREGRRRLRNFAAAFAVVAVAAGAVLATRSPLFDVDYVDVRGAEHTPRLELLRATGLDRHPLLIDLSTAEVARRAERLPWVAEARAAKEWPGTVRLDVVERTASAALPGENGQWVLVDADGRVLEVVAQRPDGMPAISGLPPAGAPGSSVGIGAAAALRVAEALPDGVRPRVGEVVAVEGGEVELRLLPTGIVRLGPPDQLRAKMEALATMVAKVDLRRLQVLDVRVPSAPVLTRR